MPLSKLLPLLLRSGRDAAALTRDPRTARPLVLLSLACITLGAAAFGVALGSHRGGAQVLYAALKLPAAVLATLALATPAFFALLNALDRPRDLRATVALALAAAARASLLLLALAPMLWLAVDLGLGYRATAVAGWALYGVAGLAALEPLSAGIGEGRGRVLLAASLAGAFFFVGGQTSWILRPYLGRPSEAQVPFLRSFEGTFLDAFATSAGSLSRGVSDERAPRSEPGVEEGSP